MHKPFPQRLTTSADSLEPRGMERNAHLLHLPTQLWSAGEVAALVPGISHTGESAKRGGKEAEVCNSIGFHSPGSFQALPVYKASGIRYGPCVQYRHKKSTKDKVKVGQSFTPCKNHLIGV